ncbi:MAG: M57 family metalloprotease [Reichenbachiella sp.]
MKNYFKIFSVLSLVALASCTDTSPVAQHQVDTPSHENVSLFKMEKAHYDLLIQDGYDTSGIIPSDNGVTVEGDLFFSDEYFYYSNKNITAKTVAQQKDRSSSNFVIDSYTGDVKVEVHSSLSDWESFVDDAIERWNDANSAIKMTRVSSGGDVVLWDSKHSSSPHSYSSTSTTCASSTNTKNSNGVSNWIVFNRANLTPLGDSRILRTITHELGHAIGLKHTQRVGQPLEGRHITGTLINDDVSIMNRGQCYENGGLDLSAHDKHTVRIVYSKLNASLAWDSDLVYFFDGYTAKKYSMSQDKVTETGYISAYFPGLEDEFPTIDAAIRSPWSTNYVYFFYGDEYLKYKISTKAVTYGPAKFENHWDGLTFDKIDAIIESPWNDDYLYFFSGTRYIKYKVRNPEGATGSSNSIAWGWSTLSLTSLDMGFVSPTNSNKIYFFQDDEYSRYQVSPEQEDSGYPRNISSNWTGL